MKVFALLTAGGVGNRMGQDIPKQFMTVDNIPVIIYTLQAFQNHPEIDGICVPCLAGWDVVLQSYANQFGITKLKWICAGGDSNQESIHNGLKTMKEAGCDDQDIVLIHDGVRPLAMEKTIVECIEVAREEGNCVVCVPATETVVVKGQDGGMRIPDRDSCYLARAPQCFKLGDVLAVHRKALEEDRHDFVDTCSMMNDYGYGFHTILGTMENIKITTPADYFMFRSILEAREEGAVFGL